MSSNKQEGIAEELLPFLRVYKNGHVERLEGSDIVSPSLHDLQTGVASKDVTISSDPNVSARLYHPNLATAGDNKKLPLLVYYHGGGFCVGSAFSLMYHRHLNELVSHAKVVAVSVEYRLVPEHPLPAVFDECWDALQWAIAQAKRESDGEEWLMKNADVNRLFIGGDSAGGNIAHHMAMRAGVHGLQHSARIKGAYLCHPYFWGSKPIGSEPNMDPVMKAFMERVWLFVSPSSDTDDPLINPLMSGSPSLSGLACDLVLVCVAGNDVLCERGRLYCDTLKKSGYGGEVELFDVENEGHVFHISNPDSENAKLMVKRTASFFNSS